MPATAQRALEIFRSRIGVQDAPGEYHVVAQAQIDAFAEATLDRQFIHIDPARARIESPYGVTIAHGFLTLSLLTHLVSSIPRVEPDPFEGRTLAINYGLDRVRFPSPVTSGSRVRARRSLASAEMKDDRTVQLKYEATVEIEGREKPACVAEWLLRVIYG
jgi:acyl dehydratase